MLEDIFYSIRAYFFTNPWYYLKRKPYMLLPGLLYAALFALGFYYFWVNSNYLFLWLGKKTGLAVWLEQQHNDWLNYYLLLTAFSLRISLALVGFALLKYILLVLGAPLFVWISYATSSNTQEHIPNYMIDASRGARLALRNMATQCLYLFFLLLCCFIPIVGVAVPIIILLLEAYYFGFSMIDYQCNQNNLKVADSVHIIEEHRGLALGNGMVYYALHLVPILGWIIAPGWAILAASKSYAYKQEG
jgi:CysZ protein